MFPLNWNIPFIRKNGSRTTLGAITGDIAGIEEDVEELTDQTSALWNTIGQNGAVNILNNTATTTTTNGVTFTVNDDKSISVNSENGATSDYTSLSIPFQVEKTDQYRVLLDKGGTSNDSIYYNIESVSPSPSARITRSYDGNEVVTLTKGTYYAFIIYCRLNVPIADKLVQPFITDLLSYNGPYVPYAKTNKELTDDVDTLGKRLYQKIIEWNTTDTSSVSVPTSDGNFLIYGGRLNKAFLIVAMPNTGEYQILSDPSNVIKSFSRNAGVSTVTFNFQFNSVYGSSCIISVIS